ncbi:MAG: hypothetical protein KJ902_05075 [Candidatus Omnitrophica bacterium]|nr:hypothetical protein [Candidatus Omnitrophota bacterium]MBU4458098.1 hypothetical protein [Candidatus Omnitrophota bacterium]
MRAILNTHKLIAFVVTITLAALFYVNQQALVYQIGLKVKENQQTCSKLVDHNRILVYNVLNLKSPVTLETKLLAEEVELDMPHKWQVVKIGSSPDKNFRQNAAKRGLFANLFVIGREAEASPNTN